VSAAKNCAHRLAIDSGFSDERYGSTSGTSDRCVGDLESEQLTQKTANGISVERKR